MFVPSGISTAMPCSTTTKENYRPLFLSALLTATIIFSGTTLIAATPKSKPYTTSQLAQAISKLKPLHQAITKPGPMDWLAQHKESGQTFAQYVKSSPVSPTGKKNVIYIQPIGSFNKTQQKIVALTAEYIRLYFNLEVKIKKSIPLSSIPRSAKRTHPEWGDKQVLSTYILRYLLPPKLPKDAAAMIAFTTSDLWPGKGWNFVFGQASIRQRVGVWSIYRNGDPDKDAESFKLCLMRTIKTAVHETSHMFSMLHCTAYECCMCGSNHREESDRRPVYLCPECVSKVCWATRIDPVTRYKGLMEFCKKNKFKDEYDFFEKSIKALEKR